MNRLKDAIQRLYRMKVSELMDRLGWDMPVIPEDDTVIHAIFMLRSNNHIWVVNNKEEMKVVGVVERVDALRALLPPESLSYTYSSTHLIAKNVFMRAEARVGDIMTTPVITASEDMTLKDVMVKMHRYAVERLPVVGRKGELKGEITLKSILITLTRGYKESI